MTAPVYTLPAPPAGDPAALHGYATQLEACADSFEDLGATTRSVTAGIKDRAQWSGDAAEAYSSFCGSVARPLGEAPAKLRAVAAAIRRHADVLERAQRKVLAANAVAQQATPSAVPSAAASAQEAGGAAQKEVDESGKAESGEVEETDAWYAKWWEDTEPVRKYLEGVLAPFDIVAADHWIDLLEKAAGQPSEWIGEIDQLIGEARELKDAGRPIADLLIKAANEAESVGNKLDAFEAFSPGWLRAAAGNLGAVKGLSGTLTGLGLIADAGTIISPQDKGAMGWVDRGAAGVNGGLLAANLMLDEIPVAGEVVMIGTGVYLAGDYLYHHWTPFRNVADDVGHGTVTVAKDVGHAASSGWHATTKFVGGLF
jgi:uncharacterized protein YukE